MDWQISNQRDPRARPLANRHYSRQSPESPQFVKPGRSLVLWQPNALWVSSWQKPEFVKHDWAGAWECSLFRNEGAGLSSDLIIQAVKATRWKWGEPTEKGFITFVDSSEVQDGEPGYCYRCAGWERCGKTESGLYAWKLHPEKIPNPRPPKGATMKIFKR